MSGSSSQTIGGEKDMQLSGNYRETIGGSQHVTIGGSRISETAISEFFTIGGDRATAIASTDDLTIGECLRVETGGAQFHKVGTSYYLDPGSDLVLQAGATILLNVGGIFIKIDSSGVTINGTLTRINSGGSAKKGKPPSRSKPTEPKKYAGPHAKWYGQSFKE